MIRHATPDDMGELLRMGREFHRASGYAIWSDFDEGRVSALAEKLMDGGGALFITDGGMVGGVVFPAYFSDDLIAQELFWWVDSEHRGMGKGKALLRAFEDWAVDEGARAVSMTGLSSLGAPPLPGYVPAETTYWRIL